MLSNMVNSSANMVNSSAIAQPVPSPPLDSAPSLTVLLVEDNPGDAFLIQGMLGVVNPSDTTFQLQHEERLQDAIATLNSQPFSVILLDLSLPDSQGLQALQTLEENAPSVPVVILTGQKDEALATQAVHAGAQDYLIKGQVTQEVLVRSIRYAIERHRSDSALRQRTLELERANLELNRQAQQLADVNADLEAFNYTIAHDLRNPLAGIKTACALLDASLGNQDSKSTRYLSMIQEYSQQMGGVFEGLLQLAQLSHSPLQMQAVDLSATAKMIMAQLRSQHPQHEMQVEIAPQMTVQGDSRLIWMLLDHLLSNAWKFTRNSKQPKVEFGTCQSSNLPKDSKYFPTEGQPIYFLKDNGIGFDMQHSDQVFAPFKQLTQVEEGQGMGLTMARCIVNRHGGHLWCHSLPNQGVTFFWTLPQPHLPHKESES